MSTDSKDGPITAQSWFVLDRLRSTVAAAGGTLDDVVKLTQYFCNLRDFPIYNEVRAKFFRDPPASTVVQPGPVHAGLTADPAATLERLFAELVLPVADSASN